MKHGLACVLGASLLISAALAQPAAAPPSPGSTDQDKIPRRKGYAENLAAAAPVPEHAAVVAWVGLEGERITDGAIVPTDRGDRLIVVTTRRIATIDRAGKVESSVEMNVDPVRANDGEFKLVRTADSSYLVYPSVAHVRHSMNIPRKQTGLLWIFNSAGEVVMRVPWDQKRDDGRGLPGLVPIESSGPGGVSFVMSFAKGPALIASLDGAIETRPDLPSGNNSDAYAMFHAGGDPHRPATELWYGSGGRIVRYDAQTRAVKVFDGPKRARYISVLMPLQKVQSREELFCLATVGQDLIPFRLVFDGKLDGQPLQIEQLADRNTLEWSKLPAIRGSLGLAVARERGGPLTTRLSAMRSTDPLAKPSRSWHSLVLSSAAGDQTLEIPVGPVMAFSPPLRGFLIANSGFVPGGADLIVGVNDRLLAIDLDQAELSGAEAAKP